jgi:hypothetical protein
MVVAMPEQKKETRPVSPEQGADILRDAGTVTGLAQIAVVSHADQIAASESVRFDREARRLAYKYGAQSPEALRALDRVDRHKSYRRALAREFQRAVVPMPPADAAAATIYGRVFSADGKPQPGFAVAAVAPSGKTLERTVTSADGLYLMKIADPEDELTLRASAPNSDIVATESAPVRTANGARVFRDLRIPPEQPPPTPQPNGGDPSPQRHEMPKLVGMNATEARTTLKRLGITNTVSVTTDAAGPGAPPGTVLKQTPAAGSALDVSTAIALVVAAAPVKLPDLRKMTLVDATVALNQLGLKVGKVTGEHTNTVIIDHTPGPGHDVPRGSPVDIKLGKAG